MANLEVLCRVATPFQASGEIDEEALRKLLQRFIKAKISIYLGSVAGAEGRTLSWEELKRIYQIGIEECKGKIPVYANPPEQYLVSKRREYIQQAIESGVDMVMFNVYENMRLNDAEFTLYLKAVLAEIKHPMSIAVNARGAFTPKAEMMADICNTHPQIVAFNLSNGGDGYFVKFIEHLKRDIEIYVHCSGSLNKLTMGAKGIFGTEANIIPNTLNAYLDAYTNENLAALGRTYQQIIRYTNFMSQWHPANPRAIKMAIRLLKLPGWQGGLREPYHMPSDTDFQKFADGMLKLGIPEIDAQARAAGVRLSN